MEQQLKEKIDKIKSSISEKSLYYQLSEPSINKILPCLKQLNFIAPFNCQDNTHLMLIATRPKQIGFKIHEITRLFYGFPTYKMEETFKILSEIADIILTELNDKKDK